jgi:isocitrate dehydrogenase (NAD+)
MRRPITVIRGDGIGPGIVDATINILDAAGCKFDYDYVDIGEQALSNEGSLLPTSTVDSISRNRIVLKGPLATPIGTGHTSLNVTLRQLFNLYANVRPVISIPGIKSRYEGIDIITVRENTQGLYSGVGHTLSDDGETAEAKSVITRSKSVDIVTFAYELARHEKRKKVTIVHKANILKSTSGLFLQVAREIASRYTDIETNEMIIDNACMQLVMRPEQFDVIVTTNLFGDIISDLCAGLVGGLGLAPGANIGNYYAIFEAVHGTAPDIAGKNIANPSAMILAAIQMLRYLHLNEIADRITAALRATILARDNTTPDLGGKGSTTDFTFAVISRI